MATVKKIAGPTVKRMVEVEEPGPELVQLTLTMEEAGFLRMLLGANMGGHGGPSEAGSIYGALAEARVASEGEILGERWRIELRTDAMAWRMVPHKK